MVDSRKVAKKLILIATATMTSSCSSLMVNDVWEDDRLIIVGGPESIRAWSDRDAGMITNGKASPDTPDTPYYQLRRQQSGPKRVRDMRRRPQ